MNMFNKNRFSQLTSLIIAGLLLLIGATTGHAQKRAKEIRMQAHITGIPGDGVGGAIDAFGSDQFVTNTTPSVGGGGAGSGKAEFGPLVITKTVDRATPKLFLACATGVHFPQVQVDWVRSNRNGSEEVFFTVLLQDVTITSVRSGLPNQNDPNSESPGPLEQISFNFGKIQWTYFLPDGTPVRGGYDLSANRPF
jgi:type VI secretion system secreted protein Hcp